MPYYRIMSERHYKDPYTCSAFAGRWNPKGVRMIYASNSPSISLLEYLCIKGIAVSRNSWYMIMYDIEDKDMIAEIDVDDLPANWNILPHAQSTQEFGRRWIQAEEFPFLKVPSARMNLSFFPKDHNLLINPDFPDITRMLQVINVLPFDYLLG